MNELNERKNIIVSLKSLQRKAKKGIDKRIVFLKIIVVTSLLFLLVSIGIVVFSIISEAFNHNLINLLKWKNSSIFVMFSLTFLLNAFNAIYELQLLQHLKRISIKENSNGIKQANKELKVIIKSINNRFGRIIISVLILCIFGVSSWQLNFSSNSVWEYMKYPVLLFYVVVIYQFVTTFKKLITNIKKAEELLF